MAFTSSPGVAAISNQIQAWKPALDAKTIEGMIASCGDQNMPPFDSSFVNDMANHYWSGHTFTTKQIQVCIKILRKHERWFVPDLMTSEEYHKILDEQICSKVPLESLDYPTEIRYLGKNILALRCKFSPQIQKAVKRLDKHPGLPRERTFFQKESKLWIIHVTSENFDLVMKFIKDFKVSFDEPTVAFLAQCSDYKVLRSAAQVHEGDVNIIVRDDPLLQFWLETHISWTENV